RPDMRHTLSAEVFRRIQGFVPHFRPPEGMLNSVRLKGFGRGWMTGLEPATPRSTIAWLLPLPLCLRAFGSNEVVTGIRTSDRSGRRRAGGTPVGVPCRGPAGGGAG